MYARDGAGWSVLETAIAHDNHEVLKFLLARYYRHKVTPRLIGLGVLKVVAEYADLETVELLIHAAGRGMHATGLDGEVLVASRDLLQQRSDTSDVLQEAFGWLVDVVRGTAVVREEVEQLSLSRPERESVEST